jgi:hypothetical protein
LDSSVDGVSAVLLALASMMARSSHELDAQEIGNALFGLKGLDGSVEGVSAVLVALAPMVTRSDHELDAQHIGNALYTGYKAWIAASTVCLRCF